YPGKSFGRRGFRFGAAGQPAVDLHRRQALHAGGNSMTEEMNQTPNLLRGISENGGVVFYGVDSTQIVRQAEKYHKTSAVATAALGRLLTAASMMGMMLKSRRDSITLQIKG